MRYEFAKRLVDRLEKEALHGNGTSLSTALGAVDCIKRLLVDLERHVVPPDDARQYRAEALTTRKALALPTAIDAVGVGDIENALQAKDAAIKATAKLVGEKHDKLMAVSRDMSLLLATIAITKRRAGFPRSTSLLDVLDKLLDCYLNQKNKGV